MQFKDFKTAKDKILADYKAGRITKQQRDSQMTKLRSVRTATQKERLVTTPLSKFMDWLKTPMPLSKLIESAKGPALKQKPIKTSDQARDAARSAKKTNGAGGQLGRPAGTGKKPPARPTPPPPNRNKKTNGKPASQTRPVAPPPGRKTKKKEKLYDTISPVTGKPVKGKVTLKQHLANLDAAKKKGLYIGSESRKTRDNKAKARDLIASAAKASLKKKGNN